MQQENNQGACYLFEKAVQASPKNRFAWHVWGLFEANPEKINKARKLLKIGHLVNPKDTVLLQSLALLEYKHSTANVSRVLFRRAEELDLKHQPVWIVVVLANQKRLGLDSMREFCSFYSLFESISQKPYTIVYYTVLHLYNRRKSERDSGC